MSNNLVKPAGGGVLTETACRHCEKKFYGPTTILRVGEEAPARFYKYLAEINNHIAKRHPDIFQAAYIRGTELQGMLVMQNYESSDPEVIDQRNYYRWKVHQVTLNAKIDDATIARKADETLNDAFGPLDQPPILRAALKMAIEKKLREIRDILQEPNAYTEEAAAAAENKPIVGV
jgi:hypothetical protein